MSNALLDTDAGLLDRYVKRRDPVAFSEIVGRYQDFVYSACYRITGNSADAEDAVQNCFLRLSEKADAVTISLAGWLHRCATRIAIDSVRSSAARRSREQVFAETRQGESAVDWKKLEPLIDEAFDQLPDDARYILVEHFLRKRSQDEIAGEMGLSPATVSRRVIAGVEQVRAWFARRDVEVAGVVLAPAIMQYAAVMNAPASLAAGLGKMAIVGGAHIGHVSAGTQATGWFEVLGSGGVAVKAGIGIALVAAAAAVVLNQKSRNANPNTEPAPVVKQAALPAIPQSTSPVNTAEEDVKRIVNSCAQCHKRQCKSVETVVKAGWIKPGNPEKSPIYERIKGLHMAAATGVSEADNKIVYDFIKGLKESDVKLPAEAGKPVAKTSPASPWWGNLPTRDTEPPLPRVKSDPFKSSFRNLYLPTGSMTADPAEILLRYQATDLAQKIAFLEAVAKLEFSREQAEKLLPYAREVRDLCEERALKLRDQWRAYAVQCNYERKARVMQMFRCSNDMIKKTIGNCGNCGNPAYHINCFDGTGEFYCKIATMRCQIEAEVLTAAQKEKLPEIMADQEYWVELPVHTRCALMKGGKIKVSEGAIGRLLLAPNAVAWLEKKVGQDPAASVKRTKESQPLAAEVIQAHRDMCNYDIRLVDGCVSISGMNFTEKQLDRLIDVIQGEMKNVHAAHAEANKKNLRPLVALLAEMRDDVEQGKGLIEEKKQKAIEYQRGICRGNYRGSGGVGDYAYTHGSILCLVHEEYVRSMEAIFKRLEGDILDEAQCKLIYDTHSCSWGAPDYLGDPVRVGQVPRPIHYPQHKVLARLRSLDDAGYVGERDKFAPTVVNGIVGANASQEARDRETKRVNDELDKIRKLSDAEYELEKYKLLGRVLKQSCPEMSGVYADMPESAAKDLTWEGLVKTGIGQHWWSPWDLMKNMEKAGKPVPSLTEQRVPYYAVEWNIFLREMPGYFLMDPDVAPSLEIMRFIARNPKKSIPVDLEKMAVKAETADNYLDNKK